MVVFYHYILLLFIFLLVPVSNEENSHEYDYEGYHDRHEYDYCIIGGGPGGLQLAYFLQQAGRDYIVIERNNIPGKYHIISLQR